MCEELKNENHFTTPSLEQTVLSFLRGVRKSDAGTVTRVIVKFVVGFIEEYSFDSLINSKSNYSSREIEDFKFKLMSSRYEAATEAILDIFYYKTDRQKATRDNLAENSDIAFILKYLMLDEITIDQCIYELPDDLDIETQRLREKGGALIDTDSKLGILLERWLEFSWVPAKDYTKLRSYLFSYVKGDMDETKLNEKVADFNRGNYFRQLILYIQKHSELLQEVLKSGKTGVVLVDDDIEYLEEATNQKQKLKQIQ